MKKRLLLILMVLTAAIWPAAAQQGLNDAADNVVGTYSGQQGEDAFKARITKLSDGTYRGQVIWMERDKDAQGHKILDKKNPDKSLRTRPADQTVLFTGLTYDAKKRCWGGTKIYDPQRGLKANVTIDFTADGRLRLKGSLLGISETVYWKRVKE